MTSIFPRAWDNADRLLIERTMDRLVWSHGLERAVAIDRGEDALTNLDIARWRALGALAERRSSSTETEGDVTC